jgi:hypothetical protein
MAYKTGTGPSRVPTASLVVTARRWPKAMVPIVTPKNRFIAASVANREEKPEPRDRWSIPATASKAQTIDTVSHLPSSTMSATS